MRSILVMVMVLAACSNNHAQAPGDAAVAVDGAVDAAWQCGSDADCASPTAICDASTHVCRGCAANAECASDICDVATGVCDAFGSSGAACDPILQAGCPASAPRCTWIADTASSGHIGCVAQGSAALGSACMGGAAYPAFDDCAGGSICVNGGCEQICALNDGSAACPSDRACGLYNGLFELNGVFEAGACDPRCDPLNDNSFGSGGSGDTIPPRSGSSCAADQGCYGFPSDDPTNPTHFTCGLELDHGLVHRSECAADTECAPSTTSVYLNGCAQGYVPLLDDTNVGSTFAVCVAFCAPADCYAGNCGSDGLADEGAAPHECLPSAIRLDPSYVLPDPSANSCAYSWVFEQNGAGDVALSPTSNTVGFCYDHSLYRYDSNGNGMIDDGDATDPPCDQLPGSGALDAESFGCVSTTTATSLGLAKPRVLRDLPRVPSTLRAGWR